MIHRLNEIDDIGHRSVGHCGGDIARNSIGKSWLYVGLSKLLGPGSLAVENIAEALNEDVSVRKHVCELANLLSIGYRLIEGNGEIVGAEDGKIGVVALQLLIGMTVYNGEIVIVVFLSNEAAGILAEGAHLILEGLGITDELGFIKNLVNLFDYLVSNLNSNADINRSGLMRDAVLRAKLFKPICAATSRCNDNVVCEYLLASVLVCDDNALAFAVLEDEIYAFAVENELNAVLLEIFFYSVIDVLCLFGAEMADGTSITL